MVVPSARFIRVIVCGNAVSIHSITHSLAAQRTPLNCECLFVMSFGFISTRTHGSFVVDDSIHFDDFFFLVVKANSYAGPLVHASEARTLANSEWETNFHFVNIFVFVQRL